MADQVAIVDNQAVADIMNTMLQFANSMALKCAVELRIADIMKSFGSPITLSQLASRMNSPSLNIFYLHRIMRMLVRMKIFSSSSSDLGEGEGEEDKVILYGLTPSSKLILHEGEFTLAPLILLTINPIMQNSWQYLSKCVEEGGSGFEKANGSELYNYTLKNPECNKLFGDAMQCNTKIFMEGIILNYKDGFNSINGGCLVDVGGGFGESLGAIVKAFGHIKGINFDQPHVIALAPDHHGVSHVAGDMCKAIPTGDALFLKHIFHNWGDEDCVKILKNCGKALKGSKAGKIIIVDPIVKAESDVLYNNQDVILDLTMMAYFGSAKERTELEWKRILKEGGFPKYKIIKLPHFNSIIEAYPASS